MISAGYSKKEADQSTFVGGNTVFNADPAASMVLPKQGKPWPPELSDAEKSKISAALDDLRRLGDVYMEFKGVSR